MKIKLGITKKGAIISLSVVIAGLLVDFLPSLQL